MKPSLDAVMVSLRHCRYPARVTAVDASLAQMFFESDQRTEWIYRGSTRLEPLYTELVSVVMVAALSDSHTDAFTHAAMEWDRDGLRCILLSTMTAGMLWDGLCCAALHVAMHWVRSTSAKCKG